MRPSAHYQSILELLPEIHNPKIPLDIYLERYFRERRFMGSKDRKAISTGLYDIVRNWAYIRKSFEKLPQHSITDRLSLISYMILIKKLSQNDFKDLFCGDTYGLLPLMPEEELIAKDLYDSCSFAIEHSLESYANIPSWMGDSRLYADTFSENLQDELKALNEPASVDIRVNTSKTSTNNLLESLTNTLNANVSRIHLTRNGIRIQGRPILHTLKEFKDGHFEIQDAGSQIIVELIQMSTPQNILDYCAGAGGKTLYLAELLNNSGNITATDISSLRLSEAKKRARRAGIHSIHFPAFEQLNSPAFQTQSFDCVVVDVPCTGSGTLRRKPELRWRLTRDDIQKMSELQSKVIKKAASFVSVGGELAYITCSLFRAENEDVIKDFLDNNPDFCLQDGTERARNLFGKSMLFKKGPFIHLSPYQTNTDGFFIAFLKRHT